MRPTGISLATKGVLGEYHREHPIQEKYTGFIRREEISKPIIQVESFYLDGEDVEVFKQSLKGEVEVTEVSFIEKLNGENNEIKEVYK